jgi:hypothetical protein
MFKVLKAALTSWTGPRGVTPPPNGAGKPALAVDPAAREEQVRMRAYFLAEAAGFPDGRADEFWQQAEQEIRGRIR